MTQRAMASARRTMLGRATTALAVGGAIGAAAVLAPAASAVAPGANGRLAHFGYSAGTADSWVEQFDPFGSGPLVPVSVMTSGPGGPADRSPSWSPDGRLVVSGDPDGSSYTGDDAGPDLVVLDAAGTTRRNLTKTTDVFELEPAWSPDGSEIAYAVGAPFGPGESVWVVDADGTDARRLGAGTQPAWSPDGRRLAVSRDGDIVTMSRTGGDVRPVTSGAPVDLSPTWAPDGRHIAWARQDERPSGGLREDLRMARPDGSQPRRLTTTAAAESAPAFSPDGTLLAFSRANPGECCPSVWVRDLASGAERRTGGTDGADWERRNRLPVAGILATPAAPEAGRPVALQSDSADPDGLLASQRWDLDGDGRFDDAVGDAASVTLDAARPQLTVRLRVRDGDGAEATAELTLRLAQALQDGAGAPAGPEGPAGAGAQATADPEPATGEAPAPAPAAGGEAPSSSQAPAAGPAGPAGPTTAPPAATTTPASVSLPATVTARGGRIAVRVTCAAACRGMLRIESRSGRELGRLAFHLPAAGTAVVRVPVQRSVLRQARRRPVALRAVAMVGTGAGRRAGQDAFVLRAR